VDDQPPGGVRTIAFGPPVNATADTATLPPDRLRANVCNAETLAPSATALEGSCNRPGIPGYELLDELGRGGMGVVYKARQIKLNRIVALKMILAGAHCSPTEAARFRTEAEAIGRLAHPNIVQVHEVNEHQGTAYLSLEYVDGGTLAQKLSGKPQPPRPAAQMVMILARAVQAAHQAGIVHRDLKPGNILLSSQGQADTLSEEEGQAGSLPYGMPKITDFGLAKQIGEGSHLSVTGAVLGTPSYMSPEQAEGKTHSIGPPADIYALGAILYEMLTGRPPFQAASPLEVVCQVVGNEPVRPTQLAPRVPRDLETICLKCLRKEPAKRYASSAELADDLHRFLDGEPIHARPTPAWERAYKWVRRHPAWAALIGVTALATVVLFAVGVVYNARLQRALDRAEQQTEENRRNLVRVHVINGVHGMDEGDGFSALLWFTEALRMDEGRPDREKAHRLRIAAVLRQCPKLVDLWAHQGAVRTVQVSPDGKSVLSAGDDGARLWSFESDGSSALHLDAGSLSRAFFDEGGQRIVTASQAGEARVWERKTGKPVGPAVQHPGMSAAALNPVASILATAGGDGKVRLWAVPSGKPIATLAHPPAVADVAFSPNGRQLISAGSDGTARIWNTGDWQTSAQTLAHGGAVTRVIFSRDGQTLVTAGADGTAKVWRASTGETVGKPLKHDQAINDAAFNRDGSLLVTASEDGTARMWRLPEGEIQGQRLKHRSAVLHAAFSPDGRRVVTSSDDNTAQVWDAVTGQPVSPPLWHAGTVNQAAWSPDGVRVVAGADDGVIRVWAAPAGARRGVTLSRTWGTGQAARGTSPSPRKGAAVVELVDGLLATSPNGSKILRRGPATTVLLCDARTGERVGSALRGHRAAILHGAFSPDGKLVVTASADQTARIWNAETGEQVGEPMTHASRVTFAEFSPSGMRVLTTGEDNAARLWDAHSGELLLPPFWHPGTVLHGAFSSDGTRLATACKDRTVRVWDSHTGEALTPALPHSWTIAKVAFSADGERLITTSTRGDETTWDLSEDPRPIEDLQALTRLLASQRIDLKAGAMPMSAESLLNDWKTLKQRYPESFSITNK
jgi:WD40 repeat protein/tRNA A-37 threonylcarbamoyl transferase component Bud32